MKITPLLGEAAAFKLADIEVEITYADFTSMVTANTPLLVNVPGGILSKSSVKLVSSELVVPFEDTADAAFNTNILTIGDTGSATRHLATQQLNKNGTPAYLSHGTGTQQVYTAADTLGFTLASMAAKSLSSLKKGILRAYFKVTDVNGQLP